MVIASIRKRKLTSESSPKSTTQESNAVSGKILHNVLTPPAGFLYAILRIVSHVRGIRGCEALLLNKP